MTNDLIIRALSNNRQLSTQISIDAWVEDQRLRAEKVQLFRDYADGDHRANLTQEMRDLLRIGSTPTGHINPASTTSGSAPFALNRMDNIISTVIDRLNVQRIEDTGETASDWAVDLLEQNRFDALQVEVHESALRDADTFVMVDYDEDNQQVRLTHEPAYDGVSGVLVLYEKRNRSEITAAVKVWNITSTSGNVADQVRMNIYYPDHVEKFISTDGQNLTYYTEDGSTDAQGRAPWVDPRTGEPLGVPIVHFKNRAQAYDNYGKSEIDDAIPLQDAVNRMMHSMVASAELSGFQVRTAKGFRPPAGLTPGAWIVIGGDGLSKDEVAEAGTLEQGSITPYLEGLAFLIQQIDDITRTPNQANMGSSAASGEALKQREIGLLGKVRRAHINFGNAWEDVAKLAHRIQMAFGLEQPPEYEFFETQWQTAEIRNRKEDVELIMAVADRIGEEQTIRELANVFDWDETKIQAILSQKQTETGNRAAAIAAQMPGFGNFQSPERMNGETMPMNREPMPTNGAQQPVTQAV